MNTIIRTKANGGVPARTFSGLVNQILNDDMTRFFDDRFWGFNGVNHRAGIPVNIKETATSYELELVAPGLKKEDFRVDVSDDMLSVSFEHKEENKQDNQAEGWLRKEYKAQSFKRSFNLGENVEAANVTARYTDGILYLSLPRKEEAQKISRVIEIQ